MERFKCFEHADPSYRAGAPASALQEALLGYQAQLADKVGRVREIESSEVVRRKTVMALDPEDPNNLDAVLERVRGKAVIWEVPQSTKTMSERVAALMRESWEGSEKRGRLIAEAKLRFDELGQGDQVGRLRVCHQKGLWLSPYNAVSAFFLQIGVFRARGGFGVR